MIIDVHNHYFPPVFVESWASASPVNNRQLTWARKWSPSELVERMEQFDLQAVILSISDQRPRFDYLSVQDHRTLARKCNEYAAQLGSQSSLGREFFAFLPMPDVEGSLTEVEYAVDTLGAVGIGVSTSYVDRWIGDPTFTPLLDELNRRHSVVFCHPRAPAATENLMPNILPTLAGILEFPFDTGRAIMSLLITGSLAQYRNIRWIFNHGGAVIPVLAGRIAYLLGTRLNEEQLAKIAPGGTDYELRRLHWDTALVPSSPQMKALLDYVPLENILFGTDYPYVPVGRNLDAFELLNLSIEQDFAIKRANPLRLFPQLAALPRP